MKRLLFFFIALYATYAYSMRLEIYDFKTDGSCTLESQCEELSDERYIGLAYIQDTLGNHFYMLKLKVNVHKYVISPDRLALLKTKNEEIIETRALYQTTNSFKKKSFRYKFVKGVGHTLDAMAMDDDEKFYEVTTTYTYYAISDEDIKKIVEGDITKFRIDTNSKIVDIKFGSNRFSAIIKLAYNCIQEALETNRTKDIYKDF